MAYHRINDEGKSQMTYVEQSITSDLVSASPQSAAIALMNDPIGFFQHSYKKMHSIDRDLLADLQRRALKMRVEQQINTIPMVQKLATTQGIRTIDDINDAIPLFFEHTMYKSYPPMLLEKCQYQALTQWLGKLCAYDLSQVDASGCKTIDDWLDLLSTRTDLDPVTSSGTSGTMSFLPVGKKDWRKNLGILRLTYMHRFNEEPSEEELLRPVNVIYPEYIQGHGTVFKMGNNQRRYFAREQDNHFFSLGEGKGSADLMYLAARLRAAAAKGDVSRVDVPSTLLARRDELMAMEKEKEVAITQFIDRICNELAGEVVYIAGFPVNLYNIARKGLKEGKRCHPDSRSVLGAGGGGKGVTVAEDWEEICREFYGVHNFQQTYGMAEQPASCAVSCSHGRYHIQPWTIPYLLDPASSKPLPREGIQTGRAAFFDLTLEGIWGGIISGDEVTINWEDPCPCGKTSAHLGNIGRFSEKYGVDDKITCAATPAAYAEAMSYLQNFVA